MLCHGHVNELATEISCCCTASMEQDTDGAETAAIDGLVSSWSENISVSFCLRPPVYGLTLWCALGLLVGGAIQVPQLLLQLQTPLIQLPAYRRVACHLTTLILPTWWRTGRQATNHCRDVSVLATLLAVYVQIIIIIIITASISSYFRRHACVYYNNVQSEWVVLNGTWEKCLEMKENDTEEFSYSMFLKVITTNLYKVPDAVPPIHAVSSHVATDKSPSKFRSIFSDNLQPIATRGKKACGRHAIGRYRLFQ